MIYKIMVIFFILAQVETFYAFGGGNQEEQKFTGRGFEKDVDFDKNVLTDYFEVNKKKFYIDGIEFVFSHRKPRYYFSRTKKLEDPIKKDLYLRLDVFAAENNENGFKYKEHIPGLKLKYEIEKKRFNSENLKAEGSLETIIDRYGIHYGGNVKLYGSGEYIIHIKIYPPEIFSIYKDNEDREDEKAAVSPMFKYPIQLKYEFTL